MRVLFSGGRIHMSDRLFTPIAIETAISGACCHPQAQVWRRRGCPLSAVDQMMDTKRYIQPLGLDTLQESGCGEIERTPLHTLFNERSLAKYSGAKVTEDCVRERDGRIKLDRLRDLLRSRATTARE